MVDYFTRLNDAQRPSSVIEPTLLPSIPTFFLYKRRGMIL
jgi:hypothetical protein